MSNLQQEVEKLLSVSVAVPEEQKQNWRKLLPRMSSDELTALKQILGDELRAWQKQGVELFESEVQKTVEKPKIPPAPRKPELPKKPPSTPVKPSKAEPPSPARGEGKVDEQSYRSTLEELKKMREEFEEPGKPFSVNEAIARGRHEDTEQGELYVKPEEDEPSKPPSPEPRPKPKPEPKPEQKPKVDEDLYKSTLDELNKIREEYEGKKVESSEARSSSPSMPSSPQPSKAKSSISSPDELKALTLKKLREALSARAYLSGIMTGVKKLNVSSERAVSLFEQSPLYKTYMKAGMDMMSGGTSQTMSHDEFEAIAEFRGYLQKL